MTRFCQIFSLLFFLLDSSVLLSQKTENLFLITLDGLRWQEVFSGADPHLISDPEYVNDSTLLKSRFWHEDPLERRKRLLPFFWNTILPKGQLYGNRFHGNKMDCSNIFWFSYPGYGEILSGYSDAQNIRSNAKNNNPNKTFLELLHQKRRYRGSVAAFASWDVFPYIINEERSKIPVNAGYRSAMGSNINKHEKLLNRLQNEMPQPWASVRHDVFTHHFAKQYIRRKHPRVVYIAYGETDDYAHDGRYDRYLSSAWQSSQFIEDLWSFVQKDPHYRNKTTFIITTDHGRGDHEKGEWKSHGSKVEGSSAIWLAVLGPDTPPLGEITKNQQLWQNQVAATCMKLLGEEFFPEKEAGPPINEVFIKKRTNKKR
ncbi:MAG: phosphoglyceromutase [Saprospiraceae bacterium]|nr:phosphoglyceromutase [Saprospiraceae bacterium]